MILTATPGLQGEVTHMTHRDRNPKLRLNATKGQLSVLGARQRFKTVVANRRWGKTVCGLQHVIKKIASPFGGEMIWWVAPTYKQARKPFRMLNKALAGTGLIKHALRGELVIETATGWRIEFKSAQLPDNLRGEGVDFMVCDEFGLFPKDTWEDCLRPTLADTRGHVLFIGTPKGKGSLMYEMFLRGRDPDLRSKYRSFHFTINDAVFISREEIEDARREMSKRAWRQEFMAEFLDSGGTVFEDVRTHRLGWLGEVEFNDSIGIGVDWAKKSDYTVFCADSIADGHTVAIKRILRRNMSYTAQVQLLKHFVEDQMLLVGNDPNRVKVIFDQTGVGEAVADIILDQDIPGEPEGLIFTNASKEKLIDESVIDFEGGRSFFPEDLDNEALNIMIHEHEMFSLMITKTGKITYGAPSGFHDDCVIGKALAGRARRQLWRTDRLLPAASIQ